jgi:hypothetical protein
VGAFAVSSNCQGAGPAQQVAARHDTAAAAALRPIDAVRTAVVDVSASTGRSIAGPVTAWTIGDGADTVEHVADTTTAGALMVFYRSRHSNGWRVVDASAEAGRTLAGTEALTSWVTQAATTGSTVVGDPVTWTVPQQAAERIAARGANGHLLVFESGGQERQLVEALRTPVYGVRRMRNVRRKLLTILWDPHKPNVPRPSRAAVEAAVLGAMDSVRDYYLENSDGLYTIESAACWGGLTATTRHPSTGLPTARPAGTAVPRRCARPRPRLTSRGSTPTPTATWRPQSSACSSSFQAPGTAVGWAASSARTTRRGTRRSGSRSTTS